MDGGYDNAKEQEPAVKKKKSSGSSAVGDARKCGACGGEALGTSVQTGCALCGFQGVQ